VGILKLRRIKRFSFQNQKQVLLEPLWLVRKQEKNYLHSTSIHLLVLLEQESKTLIFCLKGSLKARELHQSQTGLAVFKGGRNKIHERKMPC